METKIKTKKNILQKEIILGGVSAIEIALFTKHLSVTLKSGITLPEGLRIMVSQSKGKMKQIVTHLLHRVESGEDFHTALSHYSKFFSPVYINMVMTGEESGTLDTKLEKLAVQMKKIHTLKKKVQSALIYPSMVFVAIAGLGLSIAFFVLPKILPLFQSLDVELPLTTQWLIQIAHIFENYGVEIMIGFVGSVIFLGWLLRTKFMRPLVHSLMLKIPVLKNILKNMNLEKFTYTLGSLLESGLTINKALEISADSISNYRYQRALHKTVDAIVSGKNLGESLERYKDLFPPITTKMVQVGENTGTLGTSLEYLSEFYQDEVDETMKNLSNILEPVLLIFIGLIVGGVAISILGPIYEITGNLG